MRKEINYILIISLLGNIGMVLARIIYTHDLYYAFLIWNLFLAAVPLLFSYGIKSYHMRQRKLAIVLFAFWLLFLPNSPYIITDLVHLYHRPPVPYWYDMVLVLFSAMNGLILGFISIGHIETIIQRYRSGINLSIFRILLVLIVSYGVYLGRFLRFNSWDIFINPMELSKGMYHSIDIGTVGFVLSFGFLNYVFYSFFRTILPFRSRGVS